MSFWVSCAMGFVEVEEAAVAAEVEVAVAALDCFVRLRHAAAEVQRRHLYRVYILCQPSPFRCPRRIQDERVLGWTYGFPFLSRTYGFPS